MHEEKISESLVQVIYGGTIAFLVLAGFIIFFSILYLKRRNRHIVEKNQMQANYTQELLRSQLEIQEQTLKNISQEIHDNIGQALSLAKLTLSTVITNDEIILDKIKNSKQLVSKAISDLRSLSHSLDTDYVKDMGLQRAIEYELEMIRKSGEMETNLKIEGSPVRLDKQKELILFRIIQESLNNIIKHANASKINVELEYGSSEVRLQMTDNGGGVDLGPLDEGESRFGLGIRNMHNRAKLIGADFKMQSALGEGTIVRIVLPLENT